MSLHLTAQRPGFGPGFNAITHVDDAEHPTGIGLGVARFGAGARASLTTTRETAWLLVQGDVEVRVDAEARRFVRGSLFDELPSAVHVSTGTTVAFACRSEVEFLVVETANARRFAPRLYFPESVRDEPRGAGQVNDAALRFVRTIFDRDNAPAEAELVLGEVVTLPGRWSSYPPHHHPQPEIYHYRFNEPQGFGMAQLGEQALLIRNFDTVKILPPNDHAQCAAPGYAMYYAWAIRHLPDQPYTVPEFTPEHRWTLEPRAAFWWPKGLPR